MEQSTLGQCFDRRLRLILSFELRRTNLIDPDFEKFPLFYS